MSMIGIEKSYSTFEVEQMILFFRVPLDLFCILLCVPAFFPPCFVLEFVTPTLSPAKMKSEVFTIELHDRFHKQRRTHRDITQYCFLMDPHSLLTAYTPLQINCTLARLTCKISFPRIRLPKLRFSRNTAYTPCSSRKDSRTHHHYSISCSM